MSLYTVTIRDQDRNRIKWKVFHFYHEARTWMLLNGFFDDYNPLTHESAEIKRRGITC